MSLSDVTSKLGELIEAGLKRHPKFTAVFLGTVFSVFLLSLVLFGFHIQNSFNESRAKLENVEKSITKCESLGKEVLDLRDEVYEIQDKYQEKISTIQEIIHQKNIEIIELKKAK